MRYVEVLCKGGLRADENTHTHIYTNKCLNTVFFFLVSRTGDLHILVPHGLSPEVLPLPKSPSARHSCSQSIFASQASPPPPPIENVMLFGFSVPLRLRVRRLVWSRSRRRSTLGVLLQPI